MLLNKDLLIETHHELIKPDALIDLLPVNTEMTDDIQGFRKQISNIIQAKDSRLLVIIGPCSIHDPKAAIEYAEHLKAAANQFSDDLYIVMRVYFEKPRTMMGWKGLINDPLLDGSFKVNQGLTMSRKLLIDLNLLGIPAATEFLDTIIPQYLSDLISWSAVGARTVESQIHRALASGLLNPVGFKNNTDGNIKVAIDAIKVASYPHHYLSITKQGVPSVMYTEGNQDGHIILRGSNTSTNYSDQHIQQAALLLQESHLKTRIMIDCSHGNCMRDHQRQLDVIQNISQQLKNNSPYICGVMIESNLKSGKQELNSELTYGQSITDGCIGWEDSLVALEELALANHKRLTVL